MGDRKVPFRALNVDDYFTWSGAFLVQKVSEAEGQIIANFLDGQWHTLNIFLYFINEKIQKITKEEAIIMLL